MKFLRSVTILVLFLGLFGVSCADAQNKKKKRNGNSKTTVNKPLPNPRTNGQEAFKILAASQTGSVEQPFVFVARDRATYDLLRKVAPELPAQEIDFRQTAVVAAFLGTKPTAGYDVILNKSANGLKIEAINPPKGAITAQMLTSPFKAALVPLSEEQKVQIEVGADWKSKMQTFRIASGEFMFSGGFAPIERKFNVSGTIGVWQVGDLVTLDFNLSGKQNETARKLDEIASGSLNGNGLSLMFVDPGSFIDPPHPALKATGKMNGNRISLTFESLLTNVADGYNGSGKLEAVK